MKWCLPIGEELDVSPITKEGQSPRTYKYGKLDLFVYTKNPHAYFTIHLCDLETGVCKDIDTETKNSEEAKALALLLL